MPLQSQFHGKGISRRFTPGHIVGTWSNSLLRTVRNSDSPVIIKLISAVWSEYPNKILNAAADMPELLTPATSYADVGGIFWVVEADGDVIGTVAMKPVRPKTAELQKLYVRRDFRKNGLGSLLCDLVEREARANGALAVELWSDVKLLEAHRRYERLGYIRSGEVRRLADYSRTTQYYYYKELRMGSVTANDIDFPAWISVKSEARPSAGLP